MARVTIYLPDELAERVKSLSVSVSSVCQRAIENALRAQELMAESALGSDEADQMPARLLTPEAARDRKRIERSTKPPPAAKGGGEAPRRGPAPSAAREVTPHFKGGK